MLFWNLHFSVLDSTFWLDSALKKTLLFSVGKLPVIIIIIIIIIAYSLSG